MQDNIKITFYEPWMEQQVIDLFCEEYGNNVDQFTAFFLNFYNNSFQKNRAIKIVAIADKTVAGFVSLSIWPYLIDQNNYNTYQCGNVIINKHFRGKGLYNKMLSFIDENNQSLNIDVIIGFPIKEILKLYIKNGWKNPFNLSWYIKVVNVFSLLFPLNKKLLEKAFYLNPKYLPVKPTYSKIELDKSEEFNAWHKAYNSQNKYYYYHVNHDDFFIEFTLKINIRKHIIKELIIGDINTNTDNHDFITLAFKKLKKAAFSTFQVSIISIAINDENLSSGIKQTIDFLKFRRIEKNIKFIYKNFHVSEDLVSTCSNWNLYRRDLDTW